MSEHNLLAQELKALDMVDNLEATVQVQWQFVDNLEHEESRGVVFRTLQDVTFVLGILHRSMFFTAYYTNLFLAKQYPCKQTRNIHHR